MIEAAIPIREVTLVGTLRVRRVLPFRTRRSVGPFVFLDHMGPLALGPDSSTGDVGPHPHIGLSTVTYLFDGEYVHRDSIGTVQTIVPGDVNWMTAGKGVAHSERIRPELRERGLTVHGLQAWVALPQEEEDTEPTFQHVDRVELPELEIAGVRFQLIAGTAFGRTSPVRTHSDLFYVAANVPKARAFRFNPGAGREAAFYLMTGRAAVGQETHEGPTLLVFKSGVTIEVFAETDVTGVLLGGEPLDSPRHMYWNFVSSSKEKIEEAKRRWQEQTFAKIPGETEFIPLP